MNEKKKIFAQEYATSRNATQSAIKAGYSEKTATAAGYRLLNDNEVKEYLKNLYQKAITEEVATMTEVIKFFTKIMNSEEEKTNDRISAAKELKDILRAETDGAKTTAPVFNFTFTEHKDNGY